MSLKEVLGEKLTAIDRDAKQKKAVAEYIVSLIQSDEQNFLEAYTPPARPGADVSALLYTSVEQDISGLIGHFTRPIGVLTSHRRLNEEPKLPSARLGLTVFIPALAVPEDFPEDKKFPHYLRLTDAGTEVLDRILVLQGQPGIAEQHRRNREEIDRALNIGNSGQISSETTA